MRFYWEKKLETAAGQLLSKAYPCQLYPYSLGGLKRSKM